MAEHTKYFDWNEQKSKALKTEREIDFEDILIAIDEGGLLDRIVHPNRASYPDQEIFVVLVYGYVYLVPFIEDDEKIFLKTIIPSRKATKNYLIQRKK